MFPHPYTIGLHLTFLSPLGPYCRALFQNPPDRSICDQNPAQTLFSTPNVRLAGLLFILNKAAQPFVFNRYNPGRKGGRSVDVTLAEEDTLITGNDE